MTAVSYASPTYYADRLCERGRLYIRKYYNGDDKDTTADFKKYKKDLEDEFKEAREKQFSAKPHKKTKQERDLEKKHAENVAKMCKEFMFKKVAKDFYPGWDEDKPEETARNPWQDSIAGTMFWM